MLAVNEYIILQAEDEDLTHYWAKYALALWYFDSDAQEETLGKLYLGWDVNENDFDFIEA